MSEEIELNNNENEGFIIGDDKLCIPEVISPYPEYRDKSGKLVPITQLKAFDNHPFDLPDKDNSEMQQLMQSIESNGLLELPLVRKINDDEYQILSGHRRVKACEYLRHTEIPVTIINCKDNEQATLLMLNSNIKRANIKLSEQVKSCKVLYDAKKHQGKSQGEDNSSTKQAISNIFKVSEGTVQGYMELSKLSDVLLHMLDDKRFPISAGKLISKLKPEHQKLIEDVLTNNQDIKIRCSHVKKVLDVEKDSADKILTVDEIKELLTTNEQIAEQHRDVVINLSADEISNYFPDNTSTEDIRTKILELLSNWKEQQNNNE